MAENADCSTFFNAIAMPVTVEEMYVLFRVKSNSYFVIDPQLTRPLKTPSRRIVYFLRFTNRVTQTRKCIAGKHNTVEHRFIALIKFSLASSSPFKYLTFQLANMD